MSRSRTLGLMNLLNKDLSIPSYQRPYEWNRSNVYVLLDDIYTSYSKHIAINLGAIILNENNTFFDIVDGQQRLITLSLLLKALDDNICIKLMDTKLFCYSDTQNRIIRNYKSIKEFLKRLSELQELNLIKFKNYVKNSINFYVLVTKDSNEAFQLFDGRNSKYKDLTPVDLLKAYHLGALPTNYPKGKKRSILVQWNKNIKNPFSIDYSCNKVEFLFNNVLFNIYNWSLNKDIKVFSKKDIYLYKGFNNDNNYSYVNYYKGKKVYQLNKPFKSGEDFFYMTNHYIKEFQFLIDNYKLKEKAKINTNEYDFNLRFISYLYYDALLLFFDRFGKKAPVFYNDAVLDYIYKYSILLRVNNKLVNYQSLNNYVLTSKHNFFFECNNALKIDELLKLELNPIGNSPNKDEKLGEMRKKLWKELM